MNPTKTTTTVTITTISNLLPRPAFLKTLRRAAFAAAALALAMALGCGSGDKSGASGKEIIVYDTGIEAANRAAWAEALRLFKSAHPDVAVKHKPIKDDDYSQGGQLIAALRSKHPPDIYFEWTWASVRRDGSNGVARDLTPYLDDAFKATLDPRSFAGATYEGKTFMIPFSFDVANLIYYRKKPLEERGIAVPETWEQFVEACRRLQADGVLPILQGNQGNWVAGNWTSDMAACYMGLPAFEGAGENPPTTPLASPGFVKAVTRLKELRDAKAFNDDVNSLNDTEAMAQYVGGKGVFLINGSWAIDQLTEHGGGDVYGVMARPRLPEEPVDEKLILANASGYMVHSRAENPEMMVEIIKTFVSPEVQKIRTKAGLNTSSIEAAKTITSPLQIRSQEILSNSGGWVAAPDISWKERYTAERLYEAVRYVIGGEAEPLEALQAADRDIKAKLK